MTIAEENQCFLCRPDSELVVGKQGSVFCMVGLGPITDRYLLIATNAHVQSFADMYLADHGIAAEVEALRTKLQDGSKPLLMTEHGRVPACVDAGDEHDAHCFHSHFLLFKSSNDIEKTASSYFTKSKSFERLSDALEYASESKNYYLLSPHSNRFVIFTNPLNVPRQFFRYLVAISENQLERAVWRELPDRERAISDAANERIKFGTQ